MPKKQTVYDVSNWFENVGIDSQAYGDAVYSANRAAKARPLLEWPSPWRLWIVRSVSRALKVPIICEPIKVNTIPKAKSGDLLTDIEEAR